MSVEATERVKTGVTGLDDLIEGGLPAGRVILVSGEPGSGKTVLALSSWCQEFGSLGRWDSSFVWRKLAFIYIER